MKAQLIKKHYIVILLTSIFIFACSSQTINHISKEKNKLHIIKESEILQIPLKGEVSKRNSEISGLCWYGDKLILLPQYPNDFGSGKIFYIEKIQLSEFISGKSKSPITPKHFSIDLTNFEDLFSLGSGFESITINNNTAYFTIESMNSGNTETFLIQGEINSTNNVIILNKESLTKVKSDLSINNISDESILFFKNKIIPIYETYGRNINKAPKVSLYNKNLEFEKRIYFPNIEYRITDVTSVDHEGKFWAINYLFPGDIEKLKIAKDKLIMNYGIGNSHLASETIERLLEFQINDNGIELVKRAPIYLKLLPSDSRNWEGLTRFEENGFLIITDTFPETIFAYVKVDNN